MARILKCIGDKSEEESVFVDRKDRQTHANGQLIQSTYNMCAIMGQMSDIMHVNGNIEKFSLNSFDRSTKRQRNPKYTTIFMYKTNQDLCWNSEEGRRIKPRNLSG